MKKPGTFLILVGLFLAMMSAVGVFSVLQREKPVPVTPVPTVKIVVAAQNIPDRTILQASMLTLKDWPGDLVPPGAAYRVQDLVGKVTAGMMVAGEPVLLSKLSLEQKAVGLAPTLPPGLVAMVLTLSPTSAVGGAVREGDSVDILISTEYSLYNEQGDESKPLHATFYSIQDVPVLAVSGQADASGGSQSGARTGAVVATTITVLVTPQDALLLKFAREKGSIDLVLRSPQFHEQVVTDPVYLDYVIRRFDLPRPVLVRRQTSSTAQTGEPE